MKITQKCCCGSEITIEGPDNIDIVALNKLDKFSSDHKDHCKTPMSFRIEAPNTKFHDPPKTMLLVV